MNQGQIIDWTEEAYGVIADTAGNVTDLSICQSLKTSSPQEGIYLNLYTLENKAFTIKLDSRGYSVVGNSLDCNKLEQEDSAGATAFETIYALLQSISPKYVSSFAGSLQFKLSELSKANAKSLEESRENPNPED